MRRRAWLPPAVALVALALALAYWGRTQLLPLEPGVAHAVRPDTPPRPDGRATGAPAPSAAASGPPAPALLATDGHGGAGAPAAISEQPQPDSLFPGATTLFPGSTEAAPDGDEHARALDTPDGLPGAGQPQERLPARLPEAIPALTP